MIATYASIVILIDCLNICIGLQILFFYADLNAYITSISYAIFRIFSIF
jgi:hypothetical protein